MNLDLNNSPNRISSETDPSNRKVNTGDKNNLQQTNAKTSRSHYLLIGILVLLVLIFGSIAVYSLVFQQNVGDLRQAASTGQEAPANPYKQKIQPTKNPQAGKQLDFSQINQTTRTKKTTKIACQTQEVNLEICHVNYWNITPPTDDISFLKKTAKDTIDEAQTRVANGEELVTVCADIKNTLKNKSSDFLTNYSKNTGCIEFLFDDDNNHIRTGVATQQINKSKVYESYDGGYLDDEIKENDKSYLDGFILVKKINL